MRISTASFPSPPPRTAESAVRRVLAHRAAARIRRTATASFALVLVLAGCSSTADQANDPQTDSVSGASGSSGASGVSGPLPTGVTHSTLDVDGRSRTYRLFVPDDIDAGDNVPLVLGLHGGLGTGDQFATSTDFDSIATENKFIAVYPDGAALKPERLRREIQTWNAGLCCGPAVTEQVDDVAFLAKLIDTLAATLPIDSDKVAMIGHSNGAMMTWRFACERSDKIAAGVMVAGALEVERLASCTPDDGVDLLNIHGNADANVPPAGGKGQGVAGVEFRSQADSLDAWTLAAHCDAPGKVDVSGALSRQTWGGCQDDTITENLVVAGAEHPWPGAAATGRAEALAGTPSQDLDASQEAWDFIARSFNG